MLVNVQLCVIAALLLVHGSHVFEAMQIPDVKPGLMQAHEQPTLHRINSTSELLKACPIGFVRQPQSDYCFQLVIEPHNWESGRSKCVSLGLGSHLAVIDDFASDNFVVAYLNTFGDQETHPCSIEGSSTVRSFFTSGQRIVPEDCGSGFIWKPDTFYTIPMTYTNWSPNNPSCSQTQYGRESCLQYFRQYSGSTCIWNDYHCSITGCPICRVGI